MRGKYILDGHKAVECEDIVKWGTWFEKTERHVAQDTLGEVKVSTVFLSLDHSFGGGVPILFETMVFGGALDGEQERCSTWEQAEKMHADMVERVKEVL